MGTAEFNPGDIASAHRHRFSEIHYVEKGEMRIRIAKKYYNVPKNYIYYLKNDDLHYQRCIKKAVVHYFTLDIHEGKGINSRESPSTPITQQESDNLFKYPSYVFKPTDSMKRHLVYLFESLAKTQKSNIQKLNKSFGLFISELGNLLNKRRNKTIGEKYIIPDISDKRKANAIIGALKYFKKNYVKPVSMDEIARNACYSLRHFERIFKNIIGISPKEYLIEQRALKALKLLKNTRLKIDEIILQSGFRNKDHFYKYFSKRFNLSPDSFRKYSQE